MDYLQFFLTVVRLEAIMQNTLGGDQKNAYTAE